MTLRRTAIYISLAVLCLPAVGKAQLDNASLMGTVLDSSGAVVPLAKVEILHVATSTSKVLITDNNGNFAAPVLQIGSYRVTVSREGFATKVLEDIALSAADRVRLRITIEPSMLTETITVTDATPLLDTGSSTLGGTIETEQVNNLPLNGRAITQLLATVPGTVMRTPAGRQSVSGGGTGRFFEPGAKFLVDGGDSSQVDSDLADGGYLSQARVNRASADSLAEVRILESSFSAEYGQASAATINFITKSGGNDVHGSLFEYFRNEKLDATEFFTNRAGAEQPSFRLNQFGGSIGGPIVKDKLFFFGNYEGVRQRRGQFQDVAVPTQDYRNTLSPDLLDPINRLPLPNGPAIDAPTDACPQALSIPSCVGQFTRGIADVLREDTGSVKIDYHISDRDRLSGRWNGNDSLTQVHVGSFIEPFGVEEGQGRNIESFLQTAKVTYNHTFSPALVNEVSMAVNRLHTDLPSGFTEEARNFPMVTITGSAGLGPPVFDMLVANTSYMWFDTLSWVRGRHQLKVGTQIARLHANKQVNFQEWIFFTALTGPFGYDSNSPLFIGTFGWPRVGMRGTQTSFFVQDDIQVNGSLTINAGLRYQYDTPPTEAHDRITNFNFETGELDPEGSRLLSSPKTNFGPRFGLAYAPFASKKMVIRAGYGIYHVSINPAMAQFNPANLQRVSQQRLVLFFQTPLTAFPTTDIQSFPNSASLWSLQKNWQTAYTQHWNLNVQQELSPSTVLQVAYVGNKGSNFNIYTEPNRFDPSTGTFPFPNVGQIFHFANCCSTNYNSLQVSLRRRYSNGLMFNVNYTWSHNLDYGQAALPDVNAPQNTNDLSQEYGDSDYDVRHVLEFDYTYEIPNISGLPNWLGRGWQINGITVMRSGLSVNILCGCDAQGIGRAVSRPDRVPGVPLRPPNSSVPGQINPAAFSVPEGPFGNVGRNSVKGPSALNWDVSVFKNFQVGEQGALQFRAEFFNLFNTPQFSNPIATLNNPRFGQTTSTITSASGFGSNRQIQFALRYSF